MSDHSSGSLSRPGSPVSPLPPTARPYRFNWDPTQKGPESVSGTTEGRDYFAGPSRLNLLNTSSTSLGLGALPPQWSSSTHGFHAISTVLNNPHKRQAPPKAHSSLPAVAPADLPRVKRKDFDSYLRAIGPEWERLEHNNQLNLEAALQLDREASTPRASTSNIALPQTPGRPLPPLDIVPTVFFHPDFNLGDPPTFNSVTEQDLPGHDPAADPTALSYSLPLLEKFSHYADTVEQHLVREISLRSASFFAALTNLHELQSESEECLDRISKLRTLLKDVDENGAKKGLEVVRKGSRMRNLGKVREGVKFVGGVVEMTGVAKSLVAAGQWNNALGVIEDMERMWDGEGDVGPEPPTPTPSSAARASSYMKLTGSTKERPPPSPAVPPPIIPLSSLTAFAALPEHLRTLTMEITASLSAELVSVLRADLLERISLHVPSTLEARAQSLKDRLRPLLHGLARTKGVREATLSWREVVLDEVRGIIRRHIPGFDVDDEESRPAGPSECQWQRRPTKPIYKSSLNAVQGLQAQGSAFLEVLDATKTKNPINVLSLRDELADILCSAAELSNTQAAKVIVMRSEQHAVLTLADFFTFFNNSWTFVVNCEVICRKMIVGLRGVVISQSKTFLQAFHQERLTLSAKLVENEQWDQTDATPPIQRIADLLLNNPGSATPATSPSAGSLPSLSSSASLTPASSTSLSKAAKIRLRIEDRTFSAVSATSEALMLLSDYLRVIVNLSMLTTDTMSRVIEFLKAFNSRTCQVVLGAGAMRSAGLKNITAKHLALASQSLSIMIALIPYVRETFRRHLSQKQAVMLVEFDKLKRDYQEHQNEIHAKLIAIMGDRLSTHIRTFQAVDWTVPREGVNSYMSVLVRETVTLHKVLSRHLSAAVIEDVMAQVFAAINHRLSEEYAKLVLPSEDARKGLLADAQYLHQKLSELKNIGAPSRMLEIVITELRVPQPTAPPSPHAIPTAQTNANPRLLANRLRWNSLAPGANGNNSAANSGPNANSSSNSSAIASPSASGTTSPNPSTNGTNGRPTPSRSSTGPYKSPPPIPLERADSGGGGFRQVQPLSPNPQSPNPQSPHVRPESPLPALPPDAHRASVDASEPVSTSQPPAEDSQGATTPVRAAHDVSPTPTPTPSASAPPPASTVAPSDSSSSPPPPSSAPARAPSPQSQSDSAPPTLPEVATPTSAMVATPTPASEDTNA
ncbi:retrograde transporter [Mycena rebaudengoi]|nr:retrograde transporter [Mycena rebaudengoi]